ncbi:hypothetical protein PJI17_27930 [Mycobacterium kansasii]
MQCVHRGGAGLDRPAAGNAQHPDGCDWSVGQLRCADYVASQHSSRGSFCIDGVALAPCDRIQVGIAA